MTIYYQDDAVTLHHGDALEVLHSLPDASVDCCVTSPPYFGLRDYGEPGQYGLEDSPAAYVETMRALFSEVRRVLAHDGTLWLNLGDSYSGGARSTYDVDNGKTGSRGHSVTRPQTALPSKNLLGIPWRVAFALQDDGWILRSDIIWAKPSGMPESVTDRPTRSHEHVFLFAKSSRYHYDAAAISEESAGGAKGSRFDTGKTADHQLGRSQQGDRAERPTKTARDVWTIASQPFAEAHFAVMPAELARRAVVAGCKPGGVVLDPFSGSGTTGLVAGQLGRRYVGIDLSRDYLDLSLRTRLAQSALVDTEVGA